MKPLKIFYIDDEPDLLELFKESVSSDLIQVTLFPDPLLALSEIPKQRPDMVFIDYRLPNMTGEQVAAKIDVNIPCIIVTGELALNLTTPVRAILLKPYNIKNLLKLIHEISADKKTA